MGNHVAGDGFLISSLVGSALCALAMGEMTAMAESGKLTEEARTTLVDALEVISKDDPMLMFDSIKGEREVMLSWIKNTFKGPTAGAELVKSAFLFSDSDQRDPREDIRRQLVERMDESALAQELERTDKAFAELHAAWKSEDPITATNAAAEKVSRDEYGALAATICPSINKARSNQEHLTKQIAESRA